MPAQVTPPSQYFPEGLLFKGVTINGVVQDYTVKKSFNEVLPIRSGTTWRRASPRSTTSRATARPPSRLVGQILDQINTGTPPNPNASISQTYAWNDVDRNLIFNGAGAVWDGLKYTGAEFGAQQGGTGGLAVAVFDKSLRRPYAKRRPWAWIASGSRTSSSASPTSIARA